MLDDSAIDCMVLNTGRSMQATRIIAEAINSKKVKYLLAEHGAIGYQCDIREEIDLANITKELTGHYGPYETLASIPILIDW